MYYSVLQAHGGSTLAVVTYHHCLPQDVVYTVVMATIFTAFARKPNILKAIAPITALGMM